MSSSDVRVREAFGLVRKQVEADGESVLREQKEHGHNPPSVHFSCHHSLNAGDSEFLGKIEIESTVCVAANHVCGGAAARVCADRRLRLLCRVVRRDDRVSSGTALRARRRQPGSFNNHRCVAVAASDSHCNTLQHCNTAEVCARYPFIDRMFVCAAMVRVLDVDVSKRCDTGGGQADRSVHCL